MMNFRHFNAIFLNILTMSFSAAVHNLQLNNSLHNFDFLYKKCTLKHIEINILKPEESTEALFVVHNKESLDLCYEICCSLQQCKTIHIENLNCYGFVDLNTINSRKIRNTYNSNASKPCTVGLLNCENNEFCKTINDRRRNGVCECKDGYTRNQTGSCIGLNDQENLTTVSPFSTSFVDSSNDEIYSRPTTAVVGDTSSLTSVNPFQNSSPVYEETTASAMKKLVVNINNKTVTLLEGSNKYKEWVTLSAYALGDSGSKYKYNWNLLDKPSSKEEGTIRDMNAQTVSLSDLVAGVYTLKVTVNGTNSYGEAVGNVTVVSAKHVNKPPIAIVVPSNQVVKLPNSGVILDGSGSSDDKKVVSYKWELVMGPLGYKLHEETSPTLQMSDLIPGNYTVMLKVNDEEGLEGNTTASVVIVKETDYPPNANAGGDKIIYMPQTEITLYGNMSTDDHEITEWEWTKGPEDSGNAVDMQDTRTPYLHLSNLEVGHYHFILKVVDTAGQASNSSVHLYVQTSSDSILKAFAGDNQTTIIPNTTVLLDGSKSSGVTTQTKCLWKQLSGPSEAAIVTPDKLLTNVTEMTRGSYVFQLRIWNDQNKSNSTSNVTVTVIQDKNSRPIANAGGDFSVTLPVSVVIVNGSSSKDDVGIVKWLWQRDSTSLASGTVIKSSEKSPVLLFTGVVPGRYIWNLTVWDDQGSSATDTVSIIVKEGPNYLDEVEIRVGVSIENLSVSQLQILLEKLQLLLHNSSSDTSFSVIDIRGQPMAGEVSIVVFGHRDNKIIKGTTLVNELREKTMLNYGDKILNIPVIGVSTVFCQNNCSGHGECIQSTKECRCQSWWVESFIRRRYGEAVPNCDWSIVYVFVGVVGIAVALAVLILSFYYLVTKRYKRFRIKKSKLPHYSLLDSHDDNVKVHNKLQTSLLDSASETDSETEILFESRNAKHLKQNGHMKLHKIRNC